MDPELATGSNWQAPQGTLVLNGLFDVKSLEAGITKYLYINTFPEKGVEIIGVESSDESVVKADFGNNSEGMTKEPMSEEELRANYNFVKLDAVAAGDATVTVTVKDTVGNLGEVTESFDVQVIPPEYAGTERQITDISQGWNFLLERDMASKPAANTVPDLNANTWDEVSIPHCWNTDDGADGGNNYHQGIGWYIKEFTADELSEAVYGGKQVYLEMGAACKISEVYVNGEKISRHEGGYSRIRVDLTDYLKLGQANIVAISVDNRVNNLTPMSGDFTVFGGLYRDISLVAVGDVHMDLDQDTSFGGRGLYVSQQGTENVTKETTVDDVFGGGGKLNVAGEIKNSAAEAKQISANAKVYDADWALVASKEFDPVEVQPGEKHTFAEDLVVEDPELWDGVDNPYQYNVEFEVAVDGQVVDRERDRIGFRFYCADPEEGFFLNGRSYPLHGVNSHQDRYNRGYAATHQDREQDMALMDEIGANAIRFAHYQHDPLVYELAAERGITVWAEIPMVNTIKNTRAFYDSTKNNLKELIHQAYNIPSVLMWGIHNEQWPYAGITVMLNELYNTCKEEDPSRLVTVATAQEAGDTVNEAKWDYTTLSWQSDVSAWNKYFGIYQGKDVRFYDTWINQVHDYGMTHKTIYGTDAMITNPEGQKENIPVSVHGNVGMSEYGAEGNPWIHDENPDYWQDESNLSENWQALFHEVYYKSMTESPWMWGTYIWNMFEFGSDKRANANRQGVNNKGIVSYDRTIKKNAFYFYKANWADEPSLKITDERFTVRNQDDIKAKVYANMDTVELFVDGVSQGMLEANGNKDAELNLDGEPDNTLLPNTQLGKFTWDIKLNGAGKHTVVAVGVKDGVTYTDTVVWERQLYSNAAITSSKYNVNSASKTISGVPGGTTVEAFKANITPVQNAKFELYAEDGATVVTEGNVSLGMIVRVTSEDGAVTVDYVLKATPISEKKPATANAEESGKSNYAKNAVDGNTSTRWAAGSGGYPGWIQIDLGDTYTLADLDTLWYDNAGRQYRYSVQGSTDGENFVTLLPETMSTQGEVQPTWTKQNFDEDAAARYIRIDVTGSSTGAGAPSIYEIQATGFRLTSDIYSVNNADRTIAGILPETTETDLLDAIVVDGDYNSIEAQNLDDSGMATVDTVIVVNYADGREAVYELTTEGPDVRPISQGKPVEALEIDVNGTMIPNEDANGGCSLDRDNDVAANLVDGDLNTRWTGAITESGHTIPANAFPAEVLVDLEDEYVLNDLYLKFFNSSTKRYYKFAVYAGNDPETIKSEENIVLDMRDNTSFEEGNKEIAGSARYILLSVTGTTTNSTYHAASVYEMGVYGYRVESDEYVVETTEDGNAITGVAVQTTVADFLKTLGIEGNYSAKVVLGDKVLDEDALMTPGVELQVGDLNGQNQVVYAINFNEEDNMDVPVSQGMSVDVSEVEVNGVMIPHEDANDGCGKGTDHDVAENAVDGDPNTFWTGALIGTNHVVPEKPYPASIRVDMTNLQSTDEWYYLTGVTVDFFTNAAHRTYGYTISAKNNVGIETGFTVDAANNQTEGHVEHWTEDGLNVIKDLTLTVTGSSQYPGNNYAGPKVGELKVYAWRINGNNYELDETLKTINIGTEPITLAELRNDLEILGNCDVQFTDADGAELGWNDIFGAGCKMIVTDVKDHEFVYTAKAEEAPVDPDEDGYYTTAISVAEDPDKMEYRPGEKFDPTGMVVEAEQTALATSSNADRVVTIPNEDLDFEPAEFEETGAVDVTIIYHGKDENGEAKDFEATLTVMVDDTIIDEDGEYRTSSIEVTKKPDKLVYPIDGEFDPTGMEVTATQVMTYPGEATPSDASPYEATPSDAEKVVIPNKDLEFEYDFSKAGETQVKVIYTEEDLNGTEKEFNAFVDVTVDDELIDEDVFYTTGIYVKKKPGKMVYEVDEDFDPTGMVVRAKQKNGAGETKELTLTDEDLEYTYDFSEPGSQKVKISYYAEDKNQEEQEFTANLFVDVAAPAEEGTYVKEIIITGLPEKTDYRVGDILNLEGLEVSVVKIDSLTGEEEIVVLPVGEYKVSPSVLMNAGVQNVIVSYAAIDENGNAVAFKAVFTVNVKRAASGGSSSGSGSYGSTSSTASTGSIVVGGVTAVKGTWSQAVDGTWSFMAGEKQYRNEWAFVYNPYANAAAGQSVVDWFRFDENGKMVTGWYVDTDGNRYYLNESSDGTLGRMFTGWNQIKGADGQARWYYFNTVSDGTRGKLFVNTTTPDGYRVDENGCWIQ